MFCGETARLQTERDKINHLKLKVEYGDSANECQPLLNEEREDKEGEVCSEYKTLNGIRC